MPSPDQQARAMHSRVAEFLKPQEHDLAALVMDLRADIAALRAELKPVPSLVLTGQEIVSEFKRVTETGRFTLR